METQHDFGINVKRGIGFDCCNGSAIDSNGCRAQTPRPSSLSVCYWKELHSSVLIAQTMVAEFVNRLSSGVGQGLRRYMLYGAFITETKHINHGCKAWFKNDRNVETRRKMEKGRGREKIMSEREKLTQISKEKSTSTESRVDYRSDGQSPECHLLTLPTLSKHRRPWLENTSPDLFQNSVKPRPQKLANVSDHLKNNLSKRQCKLYPDDIQKTTSSKSNWWFSFME